MRGSAPNGPVRSSERDRGHRLFRYAATTPSLQVEITGPICVAGKQCAMPMLAELTMNDQKSYIDVIDEFSFDAAGKITSMRAFWNPAELRPTR